MKRPYEIALVMRILSTEDEIRSAIDQIAQWIEGTPEGEDEPIGKVTRIDRNLLGRRKLAYEIDGQREGLYVIMKAEVDPQHLPELELNMRLFNPLLRYLFIRDEEAEKQATEAEAKTETESDTESDTETSSEPEPEAENDSAEEAETESEAE